MQPAPTYHPLQNFWDTEDDAPGPRCAHTLTAIAPTKTHGPHLILFVGATPIGGGPSSAVPGIQFNRQARCLHRRLLTQQRSWEPWSRFRVV
ncbi:putative protein-serine/threonine phosphatase [Helianthus debilis subsp. tardiflorus]